MEKEPFEAAAQVARLLQTPKQVSRPRWIPLAAAAAVMCSIGVSVFLVLRQAPPSQPPAETREVSSLGKGEILIWLDDRTPLYMTFQPPDAPDSSGGKR
ncbi:MAG: hypothetical protein LAP85_13590 [Acidobacteriia bacterium]|nr:hypothetical protein [Terriglobia bacterium]